MHLRSGSGDVLPKGFVARMEGLLGREAADLFDAIHAARRPAVRLNTLRGDLEALTGRLPWPFEQVPWCPAGRIVSASSAEVAAHPLNDAGAYYQQDPAAMVVAEALSPRPGDLVVDAAAAPGGKATHAAALMGHDGLMVANELAEPRARALLGNVERMGVTSAVVTHGDLVRLAGPLSAAADAVLLDAPCSGEGLFRRSEAARTGWSEDLVESNAELQKRLISSAADLVRPGGRLVYSTCTFDPRENEEVVRWLLGRRPDFVIEPLDLTGTQDAGRFGLPGAVRIWPHLSPGDGHFVASLRRDSNGRGATLGTGATRRASRRGRDRRPGRGGSTESAALAAWQAFAHEHLDGDLAQRLTAGRIELYGHRLLHLPLRFEALTGVHVLRAGLHLGDVTSSGRDTRFEPAHALAMSAELAHGGWRGPRIEVEQGSPELGAFLAGGSFPLAAKVGLALVTHAGFALGFASVKGGQARSRLPKGLRRAS